MIETVQWATRVLALQVKEHKVYMLVYLILTFSQKLKTNILNQPCIRGFFCYF